MKNVLGTPVVPSFPLFGNHIKTAEKAFSTVADYVLQPHDSSFHFLFRYPYITPTYTLFLYSSYQFLAPYPNITPIITIDTLL